MSYRVWYAEESEDDETWKEYPRNPPKVDGWRTDAWATDAKNAAETYADYFHGNRDGWECTWPVEFMVRDMETGTVERYSVDRDYDPTFSARKAKP